MKEISRYPVPTLEEMPVDIRTMIESVRVQRGFVPNVLSALAHRPAELKAFIGYGEAIKQGGGNLGEIEKEMMILAFSNKNGCAYCVNSHGANLRILTGDPTISDQVAVNYREADITSKQKAIIEFGLKVSDESYAINEKDFEVLRSQGLSDEGIWDIAAFAAFYNMSNRLMNFLAVKPDEQFYSQGR